MTARRHAPSSASQPRASVRRASSEHRPQNTCSSRKCRAGGARARRRDYGLTRPRLRGIDADDIGANLCDRRSGLRDGGAAEPDYDFRSPSMATRSSPFRSSATSLPTATRIASHPCSLAPVGRRPQTTARVRRRAHFPRGSRQLLIAGLQPPSVAPCDADAGISPCDRAGGRALERRPEAVRLAQDRHRDHRDMIVTPPISMPCSAGRTNVAPASSDPASTQPSER